MPAESITDDCLVDRQRLGDDSAVLGDGSYGVVGSHCGLCLHRILVGGRIVVGPNSAPVVGLTALVAAFSTTCVSAARLADASSPSSVFPTPAKPTAVSIPLR